MKNSSEKRTLGGFNLRRLSTEDLKIKSAYVRRCSQQRKRGSFKTLKKASLLELKSSKRTAWTLPIYISAKKNLKKSLF